MSGGSPWSPEPPVPARGDSWVARKGFTPDGRPLARIGRRLAGLVIDSFIGFIPTLVITAIALVVAAVTLGPDGDPSTAGVVGFVLAYTSLLAMTLLRVALEAEWLHRHGASLGMGWLGLAAVDARTGGPLSRGHAWVRGILAAVASGQLAGLGFWWALFDGRRRTIHDLASGTVVVDARGASGRAARWPPRWALPAAAAAGVMATLGVAGAGTSLVIAHSTVRAPIDITTEFLLLLEGVHGEAAEAWCRTGGSLEENEERIEELRSRLNRERWDGEAVVLESSVRPFDRSAQTATVTGTLSTYPRNGPGRHFKPLVVELRKEGGRWKVCEVRSP